MNVIDAYLAELEQESATTRRVLEAVPEEHYDWRPHAKGMTMAELCTHIAGAPFGMAQVLGGDSFDIDQRPGHDEPVKSRADLLAKHDEGVRTAAEFLGGLGERAGGTWRLTKGEEEIMAMPRASAIRFFLFNHTYHHRGQLSAYLRAAGAKVPSVYGPTADEDPFA